MLIVSIIILLLNSNIFAQEKMRLAVLDLEEKGVSKNTSDMVSDLLRTELLNTGLFDVLERKQMESILKEQEFQASGCTETECAVQIGRLLSARKILVGTIGKLGNSFVINARIVDVEKGKVDFGDNASASSEEKLLNATKVFANKLAGRITGEVTGTTYEPQTQPIYQPPTAPTTIGLTEWDSLGITREKYLKMQKSGGNKGEFLSFRKKGYNINKYIQAKKNRLNLNEYNTFKKYYKNPALAGCLSLIPGIGNYYTKRYLRGTLHLLFGATFITLYIATIKEEIRRWGEWEFQDGYRYRIDKTFYDYSEYEKFQKELQDKIDELQTIHGNTKSSYGDTEWGFKTKPYFLILGISAIIMSMIDAIITANKINKENARKIKNKKLSYNITPVFNYNFVQRKGFIGFKYSF